MGITITPRAMPSTPLAALSSMASKQKLRDHIFAAGADGHAHADFTRAFGDADQHDVHNANAAHAEGNNRHGREQGREGARGFQLRAE